MDDHQLDPEAAAEGARRIAETGMTAEQAAANLAANAGALGRPVPSRYVASWLNDPTTPTEPRVLAISKDGRDVVSAQLPVPEHGEWVDPDPIVESLGFHRVGAWRHHGLASSAEVEPAPVAVRT